MTLLEKSDNKNDNDKEATQRRLIVICALLAYASSVVTFQWLGELQSTDAGLMLLLVVWGAGLAGMGLARAPLERAGVEGACIAFTQMVWLNVGIVVVACMTAGDARLWLLSASAFGIFYAATRLAPAAVVRISAVTWVSYMIALALFDRPLGESAEIVSLVGITFIVAGATWAGLEFAALREAYVSSTVELREAVRRDDLTGLFNRREFMEQAAHQKALAERGKHTFSVCFLDLDHFKRVNDRFGHQRGDDVLVRFAGIAAQAVRDVDFVARVGGEEFLVLLSDVSDAGARLVAERIRRQTASMEIDPAAPSFRVTVSLGIAQFRPGDSIEELIGRADAALYKAKAGGRDRIEFADEVAYVEGFHGESVRQRKSRGARG